MRLPSGIRIRRCAPGIGLLGEAASRQIGSPSLDRVEPVAQGGLTRVYSIRGRRSAHEIQSVGRSQVIDQTNSSASHGSRKSTIMAMDRATPRHRRVETR